MTSGRLELLQVKLPHSSTNRLPRSRIPITHGEHFCACVKQADRPFVPGAIVIMANWGAHSAVHASLTEGP
jgi:hypothetical protein